MNRFDAQDLLSDTIEAAFAKFDTIREGNIMLANMLGKVIHNETRSLLQGKQGVDLLPDNLDAGPYFLVLETAKGELAIEKVFVR
ncbi:MAG: hypothetical protein Kapaf2KO_21920 [Candidatus Kapaibacteriales bacterium]